MDGKKKDRKGVVSDEVEELLRAAEDAALLKLNLNSHTVHPSLYDLQPDLDQRFCALKSGSKSAAKPQSSTKRMPPPRTSKVKVEVEEDDLFARFAALKGSLPNPSSSRISGPSVGVNSSDVIKLAGGDFGGGSDIDDDEDEVEKVIRWAKDAARLDPSFPSDDDDDDGDDYDDDNTRSDDSDKSDKDDESFGMNKKGNHK